MLIRPVNAKWPIVSPFGYRIHPVTKKRSFHKGVDFACPVGSPVIASFSGEIKIVRLKDDGNPAGNRLWLYGDFERAGYFHLDDDGFNVKPGDKVKEGMLLGFSGDTGRVSGPHLHFQLEDLKTETPIEPIFEETRVG